jgi:beta-lactamase regulating signal transducer with metallopeptidase domain
MNTLLEQINSAGQTFITFVLPMLVQSSVLILVLLFIDLLLRKRVRAVFRYWIWMLVLVKLLLPTSLSWPLSVGHFFGDKLAYVEVTKTTKVAEPEILTTAEAIVPTNADLPNIQANVQIPAISTMPTNTEQLSKQMVTAASEPPIVSVTPVSWQGVVFLVWLSAAATMGLLLLQRAIFVRGLIAQAKSANSLMDDILEGCRERMNVRCKVRLKVSPNATSPAVCGLFRPVILVPQNLAPSLGANSLRTVLLHELAHIKRGDLWVNLAQTILQVIYFYNPLLWLANAIIRRIREQAVDEAVLVAMGDRAKQYPETLVNVAKLAFGQSALSLRLIGVVESKSALKERIKTMLERPVPKSAKLGVVGVLAIFVVGIMLLPMAKAGKPDDKNIADTNKERRFVRLVVGKDRITFEGKDITWKELPSVLEKIPNRDKTVFEIAVADKEMPLSKFDQAKSKAAKLVEQFGFEYLSYVGQHPLGSKAGATGPKQQRPEQGAQQYKWQKWSEEMQEWGKEMRQWGEQIKKREKDNSQPKPTMAPMPVMPAIPSVPVVPMPIPDINVGPAVSEILGKMLPEMLNEMMPRVMNGVNSINALGQDISRLEQEISKVKAEAEQLQKRNASKEEKEAVQQKIESLQRQLEVAEEKLDVQAERFEGEMEEWGEQFGEEMEQWGEQFGERFGAQMEQWGERFGEKMEQWAGQFEEQMEQLEESLGNLDNELEDLEVKDDTDDSKEEKSKFERMERLSNPLAADSILVAETNVGSITVTGADVTDCNVIATIRAKAPTEQEAKELAERVKIRLEPAGKTLTLKAEEPAKKRQRSIEVSFNIKVPKQTALRLRTNVGEIKLSNIAGQIKAQTNVGDIKCQEVSDNLNLITNVGKVQIVYSKTAPSDCDATILAEVGKIEFTGPAKLSAQLDASTSVGSIKSDYDLSLSGKGPGKNAKGTIGKGKGKLHLKTGVGSITIR